MSRAGPLPASPPGAHVVARLPVGRAFRIEPTQDGAAVLLIEAPTRDDVEALRQARRQINSKLGGTDGRR